VRVREARIAGESVLYGDYTHPDILMAARIQQAKIVVITVDQLAATEKILHQIKLLAPDVPIVVRGFEESHLELLLKAGATTVVPEKLEASLMLASHVLILLGIPADDVMNDMRDVRMGHYEALRKFFPGHDTVGVSEEDVNRAILHSVQIDEGDFAVDRTIGELQLAQLDVQLDTLRKDGIRVELVQEDTQLHAGDVLVLYGKPDDLARAEMYILIG